MILSICIPTYNRSNYLSNLLQILVKEFNMMNELYNEVEVCISDNNSTDDTLHVINKFSTVLPVRYQSNKKNIGAGRNLLEAYSMGKGKYVWAIGDDDELVGGALVKAVTTISKTECDIYHVKTLDINDNSLYFNWINDGSMLNKEQYYTFIKKDCLNAVGFIGSNIYKKKYLDMEFVKEFVKESRWPQLYMLLMSLNKLDKSYIMPPLLRQVCDGNSLYWRPESWLIVKYDKVIMVDKLSSNSMLDDSMANRFMIKMLFSYTEFKDIIFSLIVGKGKINSYREKINKHVVSPSSNYWFLIRTKLLFIQLLETQLFYIAIKVLSKFYKDKIDDHNMRSGKANDGELRS